MDNLRLTKENIAAIEKAISKGDRAEVIPLKDKVAVNRIKREEIKVK